ncbi:MAG: hypothetical protein O3C60_16385 [Planctomycetota bacterium]|nr:hypothetical protein [Planctomycetota bacterium]
MGCRVQRPHIGFCPFCEQGHLGIAGCGFCHTLVAICDECELVWSNVRGVAMNSTTRSSGTYPHCPHCETADARWYWLSPEQIQQAGLQDCIKPLDH